MKCQDAERGDTQRFKPSRRLGRAPRAIHHPLPMWFTVNGELHRTLATEGQWIHQHTHFSSRLAMAFSPRSSTCWLKSRRAQAVPIRSVSGWRCCFLRRSRICLPTLDCHTVATVHHQTLSCKKSGFSFVRDPDFIAGPWSVLCPVNTSCCVACIFH